MMKSKAHQWVLTETRFKGLRTQRKNIISDKNKELKGVLCSKALLVSGFVTFEHMLHTFSLCCGGPNIITSLTSLGKVSEWRVSFSSLFFSFNFPV